MLVLMAHAAVDMALEILVAAAVQKSGTHSLTLLTTKE